MNNAKKRLSILYLTLIFMGTNFGLWAQTGNTDLRDLSFLSTDSTVYSIANRKSDSGLLVVYFRVDCDDCRKDAQILKNTANEFPVKIWMVSPNDLEALDDFEYMSGLLTVSNIKVLQDYRDLMHTRFSFMYLPFAALFSPSGKLIKTYDDLPTANRIKTDLEKTR